MRIRSLLACLIFFGIAQYFGRGNISLIFLGMSFAFMAGVIDKARSAISAPPGNPLPEQKGNLLDADGIDHAVEVATTLANGNTGREKFKRYPWQTLLDVENVNSSEYHDSARTQLFSLFQHAPRRMLDIGCGNGATGAAVKEIHIAAHVIGIEINRAAAEVARTRIDQVIQGKFEDVDFRKAGIEPGSIDTVVLADVLEHMYNPWGALIALRPYLSQDAQVIASIPNIRNLVVLGELAAGNWRYEEWGLLDITHIRFFTLKEIRRLFEETGYSITEIRYSIDCRLSEYHERYQHEKIIDIESGNLVLKGITPEQLTEMCSAQIYVNAKPNPVS
jgi:2-polyprenyl-3-methyl-5-hydroxy-6-metoxy-1,4-benzoquinol methylase